MSLCATGRFHTIFVSDEGVAFPFGLGRQGQLGIRDQYPNQIPNLPRIVMVSCGEYFTVWVDYEGFMWSCGEDYNKLGKRISKFPQKIENIPPVSSICCGSSHTLVITHDSNLWSFGKNGYGQLCLGNSEEQSGPQQTSFSNILRVSAGNVHSFFQDINGEIFGCGYNNHGTLGLGNNDIQIEPSRLPIHSLNIIQFCCGNAHALFLDSEGNVFSVGYNNHGELGLGHNIECNVLNQIQNIPSIRIINSTAFSSYLVDFDGSLWSFGANNFGQLGHGDKSNRNVPTKISSTVDITQISVGSCSQHVLVKDSQNSVFVMGNNGRGQLGKNCSLEILSPQEMNSSKWGNIKNCAAKSARK